MKKLVFILAAVCSFCAANAQIMAPKDPGRKIPKAIMLPPTVVVNRTCGNYKDAGISIGVTVEHTDDMGYQVKFTSTVDLERVEIKRSEPVQVLNTMSFPAGQKSGTFYMDAGSYKGSNTYILEFYAPGKPKCLWTAAIQRKAS